MAESTYGSYLLHHIAQLRSAGTFCDVKLVAGDGAEFLAHRIVLAAVSPFFAEIFAKPTPQNGAHTVVHLKNTDGPSVATVVDFLYVGFIDFHRGPDLKVVRNIANRCQIAPLETLLSLAGPADTASDKVLKSLRAGFSSLSTALACSPCRHPGSDTGKPNNVQQTTAGKSSRGVSADLTETTPLVAKAGIFRGNCVDEPTPSFAKPICIVPPATSTPKEKASLSSFMGETTLKPFSCKFCLRTYSTSRKLMLHCDRVHAYNPFLKFAHSPFNLNSFNVGGKDLSEISRTSFSTVYSASSSAAHLRIRRRRRQYGNSSIQGRGNRRFRNAQDRSRRYWDNSSLTSDSTSRKRAGRRDVSEVYKSAKRAKRDPGLPTNRTVSSARLSKDRSIQGQSKSVGSQTDCYLQLSPLASEHATSDQFKSDLIGSETFTDHIPSPQLPFRYPEAIKPIFAVPVGRAFPSKSSSTRSSNRRVLNRVRSREPTPFELKIPSDRCILTDVSLRSNSRQGTSSTSGTSSKDPYCQRQSENEITPKPPPLPPRPSCMGILPKTTPSSRTASVARSGSGSGRDLACDERDYGSRARQRTVLAPPAPPPSVDGSVTTHSDLIASGTEYYTAPIDEATVVNYGTV